MEIKIISFNCYGLKSSVNEIKEMCDHHDIILLQETLLYPSDLVLLKSLHEDFYGDGVSSIDVESRLIQGRPYGGLAVLWRKTLNIKVAVHKYDDNRLLGVTINSGDNQFFILNVYMPTCHPDNLDDFNFYLYKINMLLRESNAAFKFAIGDFNSDIHDGKNTCFSADLKRFCKEKVYNLSSEIKMPVDSVIREMRVLYDYISSDHKPLYIQLLSQGNCQPQQERKAVKDSCIMNVNWMEVTDRQVQDYEKMTESLLSDVELPYDVLKCTNPNCKDLSHVKCLNEMYDNIIMSLKTASNLCIPHKAKARFVPVPGWNDFVKEKYHFAKHMHSLWVTHSKPKSGPVYDMMRTSRAKFKLAQRFVARNELQLRADALAKKFDNKDVKSFWKGVKKEISGGCPLPDKIGEAEGEDEICSMWQDHYHNLFNSVTNTDDKIEVIDYISNIPFTSDILVQVSEIAVAIKDLPNGKSPGHDGLSCEHFKHASHRLSVLLSCLFSGMLIHGHMPNDMMLTLLVPVVKNKCGDTCDKGNYRPIALAVISTKILEYCMLTRVEHYVYTNGNQFAYKSGHSTDMCIFVLKETISYYLKHNTPIFVCFLDASKAFDRLNHWVLFKHLKDRECPKYIIKFLLYWYQTQEMQVRWGNSLSQKFKVSNGIKQGGVLSPKLFNVYVNKLSDSLYECSAGCTLNEVVINHLYYADDLCLIAPSAHGAQKLLNVSLEFASKYDILFNEKKTVCIVYMPKYLKFKAPRLVMNDVCINYEVSAKYLGCYMTDDMSDNLDLQRQLRSIYSRGNMLLRKFSHCSYDVKIQLFNTYCTSLYCSQLWNRYTQAQYKKLAVAYNNIFRRFLCYSRFHSASGMFVENNVKSFEMLIRKNVYNFMIRVKNSENVLVKAVLCGSNWDESDLNDRWSQKLYT